MFEPKRLLFFAVVFVIACGTLMTAVRLWTEDAYAALFRFGGDTVFSRFWFWGDGSVAFFDLDAPDVRDQVERDFRRHVQDAMGDRIDASSVNLPASFQVPRKQGAKDTLMVLKNRTTPGSFGQLRTSSRLMGFEPTAVLLSLFLATPTTWRRRGWGILWGLVAIHVFIVVRVSLTLAANGFAADKKYALFGLSESWTQFLTRAEEVLVSNPTVSFTVPVFIWLLVSFLTGGLSAFVADAGEAETAEAS